MIKFRIILFLSVLMIYSQSFAQDDFWEYFGSPQGDIIWDLTISKNGDIYTTTSYQGIIFSSNSGATWEIVSNFEKGIHHILISNSGTLFAVNSWDSIYISTNNGSDWQNIGLSDKNINCFYEYKNDKIFIGAKYGLYFTSNNGSNLDSVPNFPYEVTSIDSDSEGKIFIATFNDGIFVSEDEGKNWILFNDNFHDLRTLYIDKNDIFYLYSSYERLLFSSDKGLNWNQSNYIGRAVKEFISDSAGNIYAGTYNSIYKTTDNGKNFILSGLKNNNIRTLVTNIQGQIIVGTNSGIYISTDSGLSWQVSNNSFPNLDITSIACNTNNVFTGTRFSGIYQKEISDNKWIQNSLRDLGIIKVATYKDNFIIVSTDTAGILCTSDNSNSWTRRMTNYYPARSDNIHISNEGSIYLSMEYEDGFFKSTDFGLTWNNISFFAHNEIFAINSMSDNDLLISTELNGIHRSTDLGITWKSIGLSNEVISAICYCSSDLIIAGTYSGELYRTIDTGINWEKIDITQIHSEIISILHTKNNIVLATENDGIFISNDFGKNWKSINNGLVIEGIKGIALDSSGYVYCATEHNGVFKSKNTLTNVENNTANIHNFQLNQLYPIPSNQLLYLDFYHPEKSFIILSLYSLAGLLIKCYELGEFDFGHHIIPIDISDIPNGVYQMKILTNTHQTIRKVLIYH